MNLKLAFCFAIAGAFSISAKADDVTHSYSSYRQSIGIGTMYSNDSNSNIILYVEEDGTASIEVATLSATETNAASKILLQGPVKLINRLGTLKIVRPRGDSCPDVIVTPVGTVHTYDVANGFAVAQYTIPVCLAHNPAGPVIGPGALRLQEDPTTVEAVAVHPLTSVTVTE